MGVFPWVSTGEAVAAQYEVARKEAAELARLVVVLFVDNPLDRFVSCCKRKLFEVCACWLHRRP